MKITINPNDEEPTRIQVVGEPSSVESVLEAHGFDPSAVEYEVDDPEADLSNAIQNASNLSELKDAVDPKTDSGPGAQPGRPDR